MPLHTTTISLSKFSLAGEVAVYIETHCLDRDKLSILHLCKNFGVCATTLKESFKYRHGITIHQYILQSRMTLAKKYLMQDRLSVKETAWELGYNAMSNFARDFKKVVGSTPGEFQQKKISMVSFEMSEMS